MIRTSLCLATALVVLACRNSTDSGSGDSLLVFPNPILMIRGTDVYLTVSDTDAHGGTVLAPVMGFRSANPSIASVSSDGRVHGVQKGSTTITVWAGLAFAHIPVTVTVGLAGVRLTPAGAGIHTGETVQFTAALVDIDGDLVPGQPTFQYSSQNTTLVTIDATTGLARSVGPTGATTITAAGGGFSRSVPIAVLDSDVVARLYISGSPQFLGVSGNTAYVARPFDNKVEVFNLVTGAFTDSIAVGNLPCGVVFNRAGTKAYVANQYGDNVSIIDVVRRIQTGTIALHGDPLPVAVPAGDTVLFVTTNANKLFKINTRNNTVIDSLPLPATSHHMFVHPNDTLLYVATRDGGTVLEVNWRTMTIARTFTLGVQTLGMEMAPDRSELYVTSGSTDSLYTLALSNGAITTAPVGATASTIALSADGTRLYVGLLFAGRVDVLNRATRAHVKTITTGGVVRDMATDVARDRVLVTNESGWVDIVR